MPFGSYEESISQCIHNATRLIKESGVGAIKLEGGVRRQKEAHALSQCGIAVMGHIGLTPQSVGSLGGYKVQGKSCMSRLLELCLVDAVMKLIEDAKALEDAGCFSVVIECVPELVGEIITKSIHIPTIGIGAGAMCSGQVLVYHDMLGLLDHPLKPKVGLDYIDGSKWNNLLMNRVPHHSASSMPTLQLLLTKLLLITTGM